MKKLIAALLLMFPLVTVADFAAGLEAHQRGDYAAALREWRPLAEAGNVDALNNLGAMHFEGQGVPKDEVRAYAWATLAVKRGSADAQVAKDYLHKRLTPAQIAEADKFSADICARIPDCVR
jgi:TPR repeat protein